MECVIKIRNIKINDLKNIRNGEISSNFDFGTISNSDVTGIYGQNGSGKTAFVEAFSLLKIILDMQPLPKKSNHLVYYNRKEIHLLFEFSVKNNFASSVGNSMWFGPMRYIQDLFFKTPLVNLFIKGSSVYHDDYWWEKHGKKRMQHIAETSQWGKLFSEY